MKVEYPRLNKPNSALTRRTHSWNLLIYVDGKQKSKPLGTKDVRIARVKRDKYFRQLAKLGATEKGSHKGYIRK